MDIAEAQAKLSRETLAKTEAEVEKKLLLAKTSLLIWPCTIFGWQIKMRTSHFLRMKHMVYLPSGKLAWKKRDNSNLLIPAELLPIIITLVAK